MDIYTIQLSQWRIANDLDIPIIDITAKSGVEYLAPDFSLVMQYKNGMLSELDYTNNYISKMRYSLIRYPEIWENLLNFNKFAFACYCKPDVFCHRHILKNLFEKYAISKGCIVRQCGEIRNGKSNKHTK